MSIFALSCKGEDTHDKGELFDYLTLSRARKDSLSFRAPFISTILVPPLKKRPPGVVRSGFFFEKNQSPNDHHAA